MGDCAREAREKRGPKRDGQSCDRRMIDPALDGPSELIELGKERAERPAPGGVRPFTPKGRHVCTSSARMSAMGDNSKELSPRRKRSMIASPAKASGHRRPKGLVSRKVSRASGRSLVSERGAPQVGQVTRQAFRQCFGTAPEAPSRACRSAHARQICGALPRQINSADLPGALTNVIAMRVIGSQRNFSDRRATCAKPNRWSRAERLRVPSISHCAKNDPVTP